ncbi:LysR family transcriptional regulator [Novosphingobium guangzhouense]|nr:LysR family transcriptional regulator [Novosphingobium guangzhouense]
MELFVAVTDAGSISRAAEKLNISVSAASRHLLNLEERLGVRLIQRSTRQLFVTEAGQEFQRRCRAILSDLREAESAIQDTTVQPTGLLRVTASLSFCLLHIEPMLPEFTARYPDITIDVIAANRYLDIIDNSVDVAIRTRPFEADSAITIRKLAETRRILAASPGYLERFGQPQVPSDLKDHRLLIYDYAVNPTELPFRKDGKLQTFKVKPFISTNDGQVVLKAAFDDMGILVQPQYIIHEAIGAGSLVPLLSDWDLPRLTMNIAFQTRAFMPSKVRVFVEALVERFRANDYTRLWTQ